MKWDQRGLSYPATWYPRNTINQAVDFHVLSQSPYDSWHKKEVVWSCTLCSIRNENRHRSTHVDHGCIEGNGEYFNKPSTFFFNEKIFVTIMLVVMYFWAVSSYGRNILFPSSGQKGWGALSLHNELRASKSPYTLTSEPFRPNMFYTFPFDFEPIITGNCATCCIILSVRSDERCCTGTWCFSAWGTVGSATAMARKTLYLL